MNDSIYDDVHREAMHDYLDSRKAIERPSSNEYEGKPPALPAYDTNKRSKILDRLDD